MPDDKILFVNPTLNSMQNSGSKEGILDDPNVLFDSEIFDDSVVPSGTYGASPQPRTAGNLLEEPLSQMDFAMYPEINQMYRRGDVQPTAGKYMNGIISRGLSAFTKAGQAAGFVLGAPLAVAQNDWSKIIDNSISRLMSDADDKLREVFPVYKREAYYSGNLGERIGMAEFWADDLFDGIAFAASAFIPGAAAGKVMKMANKAKALRAAKLASGAKKLEASQIAAAMKEAGQLSQTQKIFQLGASTLYNTVGEAGVEAADIAKNIKAQYMSKINPETGRNYTSEEAAAKAGEHAASVFRGNFAALLGPNLLQSMFFHGGGTSMKSITKRIKQMAHRSDNRGMITDLLKDIGKAGATGVASEGLWEENIQSAMQEFEHLLVEDERDEADRISSYIELMAEGAEGFKKFLLPGQTTKAGSYMDEAATGVFLGSVIGGGMGTYSALRKAYDLSSRAADEKVRWESVINNVDKSKKLFVDNITELLETYGEEEVEGPDGQKTTIKKYLDPEGNIKSNPKKTAEYAARVLRDNKLLKGLVKAGATGNPLFYQLNKQAGLASFAWHLHSIPGLDEQDMEDIMESHMKIDNEEVEAIASLEESKEDVKNYLNLLDTIDRKFSSISNLSSDLKNKNFQAILKRVAFFETMKQQALKKALADAELDTAKEEIQEEINKSEEFVRGLYKDQSKLKKIYDQEIDSVATIEEKINEEKTRIKENDLNEGELSDSLELIQDLEYLRAERLKAFGAFADNPLGLAADIYSASLPSYEQRLANKESYMDSAISAEAQDLMFNSKLKRAIENNESIDDLLAENPDRVVDEENLQWIEEQRKPVLAQQLNNATTALNNLKNVISRTRDFLQDRSTVFHPESGLTELPQEEDYGNDVREKVAELMPYIQQVKGLENITEDDFFAQTQDEYESGSDRIMQLKKAIAQGLVSQLRKAQTELGRVQAAVDATTEFAEKNKIEKADARRKFREMSRHEQFLEFIDKYYNDRVQAARNMATQYNRNKENFTSNPTKFLQDLYTMHRVFTNRSDLTDAQRQKYIKELNELITTLEAAYEAHVKNKDKRVQLQKQIRDEYYNSLERIILEDPELVNLIIEVLGEERFNQWRSYVQDEVMPSQEGDYFPAEAVEVLLGVFTEEATEEQKKIFLKQFLDKIDNETKSIHDEVKEIAQKNDLQYKYPLDDVFVGDFDNGTKSRIINKPFSFIRKTFGALLLSKEELGYYDEELEKFVEYTSETMPVFNPRTKYYFLTGDLELLFKELELNNFEGLDKEQKQLLDKLVDLARTAMVGSRVSAVVEAETSMEKAVIAETEAVKNSSLYPTIQQTFALRDFVKFLLSTPRNATKRGHKVSASLLKGIYGSGKSRMVAARVIKILKQLGFKTDKMLAVAHTEAATNNIAEATGLESMTLSELSKKDLKKYDFIIIDEAYAPSDKEIIPIINKAGEADTKLIMMGDPGQTKVETNPQIELHVQVMDVNPITAVMRTSNPAIPEFAEQFQYNPNEVTNANGQSNMGSIQEAVDNAETASGILSGSRQDAETILKSRPAAESKMIIVNNEQEVNDVKNSSMVDGVENVKVVSYYSAQSQEADTVIVLVNKLSGTHANLRFQNNLEFNSAMATSISRSKNLVFMVNTRDLKTIMTKAEIIDDRIEALEEEFKVYEDNYLTSLGILNGALNSLGKKSAKVEKPEVPSDVEPTSKSKTSAEEDPSRQEEEDDAPDTPNPEDTSPTTPPPAGPPRTPEQEPDTPPTTPPKPPVSTDPKLGENQLKINFPQTENFKRRSNDEEIIPEVGIDPDLLPALFGDENETIMFFASMTNREGKAENQLIVARVSDDKTSVLPLGVVSKADFSEKTSPFAAELLNKLLDAGKKFTGTKLGITPVNLRYSGLSRALDMSTVQNSIVVNNLRTDQATAVTMRYDAPHKAENAIQDSIEKIANGLRTYDEDGNPLMEVDTSDVKVELIIPTTAMQDSEAIHDYIKHARVGLPYAKIKGIKIKHVNGKKWTTLGEGDISRNFYVRIRSPKISRDLDSVKEMIKFRNHMKAFSSEARTVDTGNSLPEPAKLFNSDFLIDLLYISRSLVDLVSKRSGNQGEIGEGKPEIVPKNFDNMSQSEIEDLIREMTELAEGYLSYGNFVDRILAVKNFIGGGSIKRGNHLTEQQLADAKTNFKLLSELYRSIYGVRQVTARVTREEFERDYKSDNPEYDVFEFREIGDGKEGYVWDTRNNSFEKVWRVSRNRGPVGQAWRQFARRNRYIRDAETGNLRNAQVRKRSASGKERVEGKAFISSYESSANVKNAIKDHLAETANNMFEMMDELVRSTIEKQTGNKVANVSEGMDTLLRNIFRIFIETNLKSDLDHKYKIARDEKGNEVKDANGDVVKVPRSQKEQLELITKYFYNSYDLTTVRLKDIKLTESQEKLLSSWGLTIEQALKSWKALEELTGIENLRDKIWFPNNPDMTPQQFVQEASRDNTQKVTWGQVENLGNPDNYDNNTGEHKDQHLYQNLEITNHKKRTYYRQDGTKIEGEYTPQQFDSLGFSTNFSTMLPAQLVVNTENAQIAETRGETSYTPPPSDTDEGAPSDEYGEDIPFFNQIATFFSFSRPGKLVSRRYLRRKLKQMFPNMTRKQMKEQLRFVENIEDAAFKASRMIGEKSGKAILGQTRKAIITLVNEKGKSYDQVLYHEAFHVIWRYVLNEEQRERLKDALVAHLESYGNNKPKLSKDYDPNAPGAKIPSTDSEFSEAMAELFQIYAGDFFNSTDYKSRIKRLKYRIQGWIRDLVRFFTFGRVILFSEPNEIFYKPKDGGSLRLVSFQFVPENFDPIEATKEIFGIVTTPQDWVYQDLSWETKTPLVPYSQFQEVLNDANIRNKYRTLEMRDQEVNEAAEAFIEGRITADQLNEVKRRSRTRDVYPQGDPTRTLNAVFDNIVRGVYSLPETSSEMDDHVDNYVQYTDELFGTPHNYHAIKELIRNIVGYQKSFVEPTVNRERAEKVLRTKILKTDRNIFDFAYDTLVRRLKSYQQEYRTLEALSKSRTEEDAVRMYELAEKIKAYKAAVSINPKTGKLTFYEIIEEIYPSLDITALEESDLDKIEEFEEAAQTADVSKFDSGISLEAMDAASMNWLRKQSKALRDFLAFIPKRWDPETNTYEFLDPGVAYFRMLQLSVDLDLTSDLGNLLKDIQFIRKNRSLSTATRLLLDKLERIVDIATMAEALEHPGTIVVQTFDLNSRVRHHYIQPITPNGRDKVENMKVDKFNKVRNESKFNFLTYKEAKQLAEQMPEDFIFVSSSTDSYKELFDNVNQVLSKAGQAPIQPYDFNNLIRQKESLRQLSDIGSFMGSMQETDYYIAQVQEDFREVKAQLIQARELGTRSSLRQDIQGSIAANINQQLNLITDKNKAASKTFYRKFVKSLKGKAKRIEKLAESKSKVKQLKKEQRNLILEFLEFTDQQNLRREILRNPAFSFQARDMKALVDFIMDLPELHDDLNRLKVEVRAGGEIVYYTSYENGEPTRQVLYKNPGHVWLEDQRGRVSRIINLLEQNYDKRQNPSIISGDNNRIFKFHLSTFIYDVLNALKIGRSRTYKIPDHVSDHNIFKPKKDKSNSINRVRSQGEIDSNRNKRFNRTYTRSWLRLNKRGFLSTVFVSGFLGGINLSSTDSPSYFQLLGQQSNKPRPIGATVNAMSYAEVREAVKSTFRLLASEQDISKYSFRYERKFVNAELFKQALQQANVTLQEVMENPEAMEAATKLVMQGFVEIARNFADDIIESEAPVQDSKGKLLTIISKLLGTEEELKNDHGKTENGKEFIEAISNFRQEGKNKFKAKPVQEGTYIHNNKSMLPIAFAFVTNYYLNSYHLNYAVAGTPNAYKNSLDLIKRMKGAAGPGNTPANFGFDVNGVERNFRALIVGDERVDVDDELNPKTGEIKNIGILSRISLVLYNKTMTELEEDPDMKEEKEEMRRLRDLFESIDLSDGQGFITQSRFEDLKRIFGDGYDLGRVMKPVYYGPRNEEAEDGTITPVFTYAKMSTIVLSDELMDVFPGLKKLALALENQGIGEMYFSSAIKVGNPATITDLTQMNKWLTETPEETLRGQEPAKGFPQSALVNLDNSYYRMQLNPRSKADKDTALPTQLVYFMNVLNDLESASNFKEVVKVYNALSMLFETGLSQFKGEAASSMSDLKRFIKKSLNRFEEDRRYAEMISKDMPLDAPIIEKKALIRIASELEKLTTRVRFPGGKMVLQSAFRTETMDYIDVVTGEKQRLRNNQRLSYVRQYDRNGNTQIVAEVVIPRQLLAELTDEEVNALIRGEKTLYDYPHLLGFRIPSTELHSGVVLKVVGIYDKAGTNVVIAPDLLVALHGSDFDVDSLFVARRPRATEDFYLNSSKKLRHVASLNKKISVILNNLTPGEGVKPDLALNKSDYAFLANLESIRRDFAIFSQVSEGDLSNLDDPNTPEFQERINELFKDFKERYERLNKLETPKNNMERQARTKTLMDKFGKSIGVRYNPMKKRVNAEGRVVKVPANQRWQITSPVQYMYAKILNELFDRQSKTDYRKFMNKELTYVKNLYSGKGKKREKVGEEIRTIKMREVLDDVGELIGIINQEAALPSGDLLISRGTPVGFKLDENTDTYVFDESFDENIVEALDAIDDDINFAKAQGLRTMVSMLERNKKKLLNLKKDFYRSLILDSLIKTIADKKNARRIFTPVNKRFIDGPTNSAASVLESVGKKLEETLDMSNPSNAWKAYKSVSDGSLLTGIFANAIKSLAYIVRAGGGDITEEHMKEYVKVTEEYKVQLKKVANRGEIILDRSVEESEIVEILEAKEGAVPELAFVLSEDKTFEKNLKQLKNLYNQREASIQQLSTLTQGASLQGAIPALKKSAQFSVKIDGKEEEINSLVQRIRGKSQQTIWDILDALVNVAIDNVKDQGLPKVNATVETAPLWIAGTAVGLPQTYTSLLANQPAVEDVIKLLERSEFKNNPRMAIQSLKNMIDDFFKNKAGRKVARKVLSEEDLKSTFNDKGKGFYASIYSATHNVQKDDQLVEQMELYYNILEVVDKLFYIGEYINAVSYAVGVVRDLPVTAEEMEMVFSRFGALGEIIGMNYDRAFSVTVQKKINGRTREVTIDDPNRMTLKQFTQATQNIGVTLRNSTGAPFSIPNFFKVNPHILSAYRTVYSLNDVMERTFRIHHPLIKHNLEKLGLPLRLHANRTYSKVALRREFSKYIFSQILETKTADSRASVSNGPNDFTIFGNSAWSHNFVKKVVQMKREAAFEDNAFLNAIIRTGDVVYKLSMTEGVNLDSAQLVKLQRSYNDLIEIIERKIKTFPSEQKWKNYLEMMNEGFIEYAILNYGIEFGTSNYSILLPAEKLTPYFKQFGDKMDEIIADEDIRNRHMEHFKYQAMLVNTDKFTTYLSNKKVQVPSNAPMQKISITNRSGRTKDGIKIYKSNVDFRGNILYYDYVYEKKLDPEETTQPNKVTNAIFPKYITKGEGKFMRVYERINNPKDYLAYGHRIYYQLIGTRRENYSSMTEQELFFDENSAAIKFNPFIATIIHDKVTDDTKVLTIHSYHNLHEGHEEVQIYHEKDFDRIKPYYAKVIGQTRDKNGKILENRYDVEIIKDYTEIERIEDRLRLIYDTVIDATVFDPDHMKLFEFVQDEKIYHFWSDETTGIVIGPTNKKVVQPLIGLSKQEAMQKLRNNDQFVNEVEKKHCYSALNKD